MSLFIKGVTKLSELTIDADKDWQAMGISNIKEIAAGMTKGDVVFFDGTRIVKLSPGIVSSTLKTKGTVADPLWSFADVLP